MRVFILSTGRCGSTTLAKACKKITNYTSAHESLQGQFGDLRLDYLENHIEIDNRLSWHLGQLHNRFGDEAFYVHLKRNQDKVAESYSKRFFQFNSIMDAYCNGIVGRFPEFMNNKIQLEASYDYVDTVTANIDLFLADKTKKMVFDFENRFEDFPVFWKKIGAEGNFEEALKELEIKYNAKPKHKNFFFKRRLKIYLTKEWRHFKAVKNRSI